MILAPPQELPWDSPEPPKSTPRPPHDSPKAGNPNGVQMAPTLKSSSGDTLGPTQAPLGWQSLHKGLPRTLLDKCSSFRHACSLILDSFSDYCFS